MFRGKRPEKYQDPTEADNRHCDRDNLSRQVIADDKSSRQDIHIDNLSGQFIKVDNQKVNISGGSHLSHSRTLSKRFDTSSDVVAYHNNNDKKNSSSSSISTPCPKKN